MVGFIVKTLKEGELEQRYIRLQHWQITKIGWQTRWPQKQQVCLEGNIVQIQSFALKKVWASEVFKNADNFFRRETEKNSPLVAKIKKLSLLNHNNIWDSDFHFLQKKKNV